VSRIDEALRRAGGKSAAGMLAPDTDAAADAVLWDFPEEQAQNPAALQEVTLAHVGEVAPANPLDALEPEAPSVVDDALAPAVLPGPASAARGPLLVRATAGAAVADRPAVSQPVPAEILVTGTHRKDAVEQYRKLAATLHHVQANRGVRVLLCTSAVMAEGKTVTAANLALTLSHSYQRRVLLIDADLRRPRIHTLFNIPNKDGFYEALGAEADRKVSVVPVSPYLSVVTAGRPGPDPVHVLTSERLARVLEDAGSSFDWVIIDTPPVLVLPDAGLLMGLVDGAVLVIGAGQTTYRMAKRAADALGRDRIIGVVMNRVDDSQLQEGYGSYYGYYDPAPATEQVS
jgi:protein-tyrosine kinase